MIRPLAIPIVPARDLDEAIAYVGGLGFIARFRQDAPDGNAIRAHADGREIHLLAATMVPSRGTP